MMISLSFIIYPLFISHAVAQTLMGSAPSHVSMGEQFRLTYTISVKDVDEFRVGNIPDAFEVLIGPNRSVQSSYQMINGVTSSTSSITFTYIVVATKNGSFTIPPARVVVNGKSITSNTIKITVSGKGQRSEEHTSELQSR